MIEIKKLHKHFDKLHVLNDINLNCITGESIALIGPNGCGKTTLIKSILNMTYPDKGQVIFEGKDIKNEDEYRANIGYMPQIGRYPENMTVGQILETIKSLRSNPNNIDNELYEAYKMKALSSKRMNTLSGGTRQKVSACIAFMFSPKVLILDEPTAGLDPLASEILKEKIILEKNKGKLILITSHQLSDLDDVISEIIFMQDGKVIFHNKTEDLKKKTQQTTIAKSISVILKNQLHV